MNAPPPAKQDHFFFNTQPPTHPQTPLTIIHCNHEHRRNGQNQSTTHGNVQTRHQQYRRPRPPVIRPNISPSKKETARPARIKTSVVPLQCKNIHTTRRTKTSPWRKHQRCRHRTLSFPLHPTLPHRTITMLVQPHFDPRRAATMYPPIKWVGRKHARCAHPGQLQQQR